MAAARLIIRLLYLDPEENLVTAGRTQQITSESRERGSPKAMLLPANSPLVPSEMACLDNSPGRIKRTEVWISRDVIVALWLYCASLDASRVMRSKMSLTNELRMSIALFEIPVSG
ncbi:BQ5605_C001g00845 [Microbotryum silenes-dioicae]|uniref:BQ5605_C001g00845 protein n=1 Tax=Microbotryum silenes-dioicae TaxID=796604 RepID=A0A2X0P704_9BASI|nr:BQ5605_C001g00845 [Microbotryum silenes-dioicae]